MDMSKVKLKKKMAMGKMQSGGMAKKKMAVKSKKIAKKIKRIMFKWPHLELHRLIYRLMIS